MPTRAEAAKRREARDKAHARHITATYGITADQYWECYNFQGGKCAICCIATGRTRRLAVDHDHKCIAGHDPKKGCAQCVRGLLCSRCNRILGLFRDAVSAFERAIRYLTDPPFQNLRKKAN